MQLGGPWLYLSFCLWWWLYLNLVTILLTETILHYLVLDSDKTNNNLACFVLHALQNTLLVSLYDINMHYQILFRCVVSFQRRFSLKRETNCLINFQLIYILDWIQSLGNIGIFCQFFLQPTQDEENDISFSALDIEHWAFNIFLTMFQIYLFLMSDGQWVKNLNISIQHFAIVTFEWEFTKFHKKRQVNILVQSSIFLFH